MVFRCSINIPLVYALALSSGYVQAQDFDLDLAVAHALKNNPALSAGRYQVGASAARTQASKARHLPTLMLSHTVRLSDNPLDAFADKLNTRQVTSTDFEPARLNHPGSSDLYFTELALRWPVYSGGRLSAMEEDAEHTERNARLQYQRERKQIAFNTMSAYLFVKATEQGLVIAEEAVAAARQHANTTARLAREGRIVESDKLAAAVNLAAVRSQREQAETRRRSAVDEFKMVTGLPMDSEISLAEENITPVSGDISVSENEKLALDNRKDLAAARAIVQASQARVEAARSVHKPSVDVVLSSNWYDDNPGFESQSSSIMGVISFDLYNGENSAEVDVTLAQQREMQWQLQSLELSVQKQVRDAYNRLLESRKRLAIAEDNVKDARRTVKLVQQRYGQGRTILLDLLQSEQLYTSARIEKLTARLNLNVARAELPLTTGTLMLPDMVSP